MHNLFDGLIISFDYGISKIGVAVGNKLTKTAHPLGCVNSNHKKTDWIKIEKIISEWDPVYIVIGFPFDFLLKDSFITKKILSFAKDLKLRYKKEYFFHDEKLTTVEAKSFLYNKDYLKNFKKGKIDSIAACIILESWLLRLS